MARENIPDGPADHELVDMRFTGAAVREFVAMLNMNKIRDGEGRLIIFGLEPVGGSWLITETLWSDR